MPAAPLSIVSTCHMVHTRRLASESWWMGMTNLVSQTKELPVVWCAWAGKLGTGRVWNTGPLLSPVKCFIQSGFWPWVIPQIWQGKCVRLDFDDNFLITTVKWIEYRIKWFEIYLLWWKVEQVPLYLDQKMDTTIQPLATAKCAEMQSPLALWQTISIGFISTG